MGGQRRPLLPVVFREWAPEKRIISTGDRRPISRLEGSIIECNAPVVRCVNYDYLEGCYRRFCRRPTAKLLRLVTCSSLIGQLPVSCSCPPTVDESQIEFDVILAYWSTQLQAHDLIGQSLITVFPNNDRLFTSNGSHIISHLLAFEHPRILECSLSFHT